MILFYSESTTPEVEKEEKEVEESTETVKVKNGDAAKNGDAEEKDVEKEEKEDEDDTGIFYLIKRVIYFIINKYYVCY